MPEPHLIAPPPVSTPADLKRSRGRGRDLPDDLLKAASLRLGVMSLLFAVLWVVGVVGGHLAAHAIYPDSPRWRQLDAGDAIALAAVIVSLALFAYTRRGQRDPKFVLDLGLVYMVFTAFALSQLFHLGGPSKRHLSPGDFLGRRGRADVRRHRAEHAEENADGGAYRRIDESDPHARI